MKLSKLIEHLEYLRDQTTGDPEVAFVDGIKRDIEEVWLERPRVLFSVPYVAIGSDPR